MVYFLIICVGYFSLIVYRSFVLSKTIETELVEQPPDFNKFPTFESTVEAEQEVQSNPDIWQLRLDLIRAYFFQYSDVAGASECAKNHIDWLVSHHPETQVYYVEWKSYFIGNSTEELKIIEKWKAVLAKNKDNSMTLRNAGLFSTNLDNLLALSCFQKCIDLDPLSPKAMEDFIFFCTLFENPILTEKAALYQKKLNSHKWTESDYRAVLKLKEKLGALMPSFLYKPLLFVLSFLAAKTEN
jgi:hypothetical protein